MSPNLYGYCCTPKFALPYSSRIVKIKVTKFPQGCAAQLSPRQSKLGFEFWSSKWTFQGPNQASYAYKCGQVSSYQVSRLSAENCTVKTLIALQSTIGAKWSFGSQKFKFLVNISFWSHKHHLINSWSWFSKLGSKSLKMQKFPYLDSWKSQL